MAKKLDLIDEAEQRYVVQSQRLGTIAAALGVSERTLSTWKSDAKAEGNDWDRKRAARLQSIAAFPDELNELARELCRSIMDDLKSGKPIDQSRAILFRGILGKTAAEKKFAEAVKAEAEAQAPKAEGFSSETISRVQRDILGLPG